MHILNKYCEHIFVITIDKYNRKKIITDRLNDVKFEFFNGSDSTMYTDEFYKNYLDNRLPNSHCLGKGNLGCTLSHLNLYKKIYNEKLNNVLILEDDACLTENVYKLDEYFNQLENYDFIYFGLVNGNINYDKYLSSNYKKNVFKLTKNLVLSNSIYTLEGTNAYFIRDYNYLKNMIEFQSKWLYTADGALIEYLKLYDLTYYLFLPQIIKTNDNNLSISYKIDRNQKL